jgi:hypothetical protein
MPSPDRRQTPRESRTHMECWFAMGETPEGLQKAQDYLYRTAASQLTNGGLRCVVQSARETLEKKNAQIADLEAELTRIRGQGC